MKRSSIIVSAAAAALTLCFGALALAQSLGAGIPLNQDSSKSPEQIEKQKKIDEDYRATLKKIPDAKANDPWGSMRSADTGTQAKPTQLKPKTTAPKKTTNAVN